MDRLGRATLLAILCTVTACGGGGGGGASAPVAVLSINPNVLGFAPRSVGTTSAPEPIIVSNVGAAPLTFSSIQLIGADAGAFSQTNNCGSTLAAGGSCTVTATFTPTAARDLSAKVQIESSATSVPASMTLQGQGIT